MWAITVEDNYFSLLIAGCSPHPSPLRSLRSSGKEEGTQINLHKKIIKYY
jgi:hypothetical protein